MDALDSLRSDVLRYGCAFEQTDWALLEKSALATRASNRSTLLCSGRIAQSWVFVASGFAASYYTHQDGRQSLTRFFEAGQLAGNVTSVWAQDYGSDELVAIGDVTYVELPHELLLKLYMGSGGLGDYIRLKVIDTIRYDKDLLVCQALNDPGARYQFLHERHSDLMKVALKKDVAAFLGVTPQGYSRFLRRQNAS